MTCDGGITFLLDEILPGLAILQHGMAAWPGHGATLDAARDKSPEAGPDPNHPSSFERRFHLLEDEASEHRFAPPRMRLENGALRPPRMRHRIVLTLERRSRRSRRQFEGPAAETPPSPRRRAERRANSRGPWATVRRPGSADPVSPGDAHPIGGSPRPAQLPPLSAPLSFRRSSMPT